MLLIILVVSLIAVAGVVVLNEAGRVMLPAVIREPAVLAPAVAEPIRR